MLSCKDSIALLLAYLDGDMTEEQKQHLEAHMGSCSPCVEFLKSYKETSKLCRKSLAAKVPTEVTARLTDFLRKNYSK